MKRSTWLHLRIPFSFFLLPVYLYALGISDQIDWQAAASMFVILHFLLYPASNGYNSYFDKDQKSIGGLEHPPKVTGQLYGVSLALDALAILWGCFLGWQVALMLLTYGMVSKAYSHPSIRLKKYPVTGWLAAGIFQGGFTLTMVYLAINPGEIVWDRPEVLWAAGLSTLLLWGSFPMTQVYQHEEDGIRDDMTISRKLGIRGTFLFTALVFALADAGFIYYFLRFETLTLAVGFQVALAPVLLYFIRWWLQVWKDPTRADYRHTMSLNLISAASLNIFFGIYIITQ